MKPTMNLRFIEREIQEPFNGYENVTKGVKKLILQQQWAEQSVYSSSHVNKTEWRDVPTETE